MAVREDGAETNSSNFADRRGGNIIHAKFKVSINLF